MTAAAPTADQEDLLSLVLDSTSTEQLARQLATRTAEQCARMLHALKDFLSTLSRRAGVGAPKVHLTMLVAALETTPVQVASVLDLFACSELSRNREALDAVTASLIARGPQWCERLASHLLSRRDRRIEALAPVLHPLLAAHDLPLPEHCEYWTGWVRLEAQHVDSPRWTESFLAACAAPGAFAAIPTADARCYAETASSALARVRARGGLDDVALLRALLRVFERGDRPGAQRGALIWFRLLGLTKHLWTERARLFAALPGASGSVVELAVDSLLAGGPDGEPLTGAELTALALEVLPRKERGPKRAVLEALRRADTPPSPELTDVLRVLAAGTDTMTAALAQVILIHWGPDAPAAGPRTGAPGLWREPEGIVPEPLTELDDAALVRGEPGLIGLLERAGRGWGVNAMVLEQCLAALVAVARREGPQELRRLLAGTGPCHSRELLARSLRDFVEGRIEPGTEPRPATTDTGPLSFLTAQRIRDVIGLLGTIPCLLSTPSHADWSVSWEAFAQRARRYRREGVALMPTDVAIALARLDRRRAPSDLTDFAQPIYGRAVTLERVLEHWRNHPARRGELELMPSRRNAAGWSTTPADQRLIAEGDEPVVFDLLGLRNAWSLPYHVRSVFARHELADLRGAFWPPRGGDLIVAPEWESTRLLLPEHPTRPAAVFLGEFLHAETVEAIAHAGQLTAVARPLGPVLTFGLLVLACGAPAQHREAVAEMLLTAWDEERLTPSDLLAAWRSPWWDADWGHGLKPRTHSTAGAVATLDMVARAGGLALVWPLLTAIAEELAGAERLPAATSGVLETVLELLAEVRAAGVAVELPNVTALAARGGSSGAVRAARLIVSRLT